MTYTPGPWEIRIRDDGSESIVGAYHSEPGFHPWTGGHLLVCELADDKHHREANARLIAAAPETAAERDRLKAVNAELLAELKRTLSWLTSYPGGGAMGAYDRVRATIAKDEQS